MGFIRKILDIFKAGRSGENEAEVLYHDRFGEEYRMPDNYREIKFTGEREFGVPEVKICAAILLSGGRNGSEIRNNDGYSLYFKGRYGIANISTLHQWLYQEGYFRDANLHEALSLYKLPELKTILESLGLKKTGKKADLIDRIIQAADEGDKERIINQCKHLFPTDKGRRFLQENEDYVMYHRKSYAVTFDEFNRHRILQGRKRLFHDTIFQALTELASAYQFKQYFSRLEMIYHNLSEVLYDEGKYELSLRYALLRLYCSTNLASHAALFNADLVKFGGIRKQIEHIKACNDAFNRYTLDRIIELKPYYNDSEPDIIYGLHILPYTIFGKEDFSCAMRDLLYGDCFDADRYTDRICENYKKYIKKFL